MQTAPQATVTYQGKSTTFTISEENTQLPVVDLYTLPVGTHTDPVEVTVKNAFGTYSWTLPFSVTISNASSYSGDGAGTDYVQIGGVKWARGNLVYSNNSYFIQTDRNGVDYSFFSYAKTNADDYWSHNHISSSNNKLVYPTTSNVQGLTSSDAATAHLGSGWMTPRKADFEKLMSYSSRIFTNNGLLFAPNKNNKHFESKTNVGFFNVPKEAIILKMNGYRRWNYTSRYGDLYWSYTNTNGSSEGRYLCSDGVYYSGSTPQVQPYEFSFTTTTMGVTDYDCHYTANIRPIKR